MGGWMDGQVCEWMAQIFLFRTGYVLVHLTIRVLHLVIISVYFITLVYVCIKLYI